ncbi:ATP-dependent RNA helicase rok1-like protein [Elsinoe fawcettii]|nr:ATP-dependent RNA helicase rok1-like protein [Elsinoe fawcettii]
MDPLALLTRSSKPGKRSVTLSSGRLPSKGPAENPQLFSTQDSAENGRKRKRGPDGPVSTVANGTDFFGDVTSPIALEHGTSKEELSEDDSPKITATRNLDERKRILREHKLKISLLRTDESQGDNSQPKKKRKRKEVPEKKKKKDAKHADQIYPEPLVRFGQLRRGYGISADLSRNIAEQGFKLPTEVQMASLPLLLGGIPKNNDEPEATQGSDPDSRDVDLLTIAPTGSGKTLAFLIPLLQKLVSQEQDQSHTGPRAVILAPTKELVNQIVNEGRKLAIGLDLDISAARKGLSLTPTPSGDLEASSPPQKLPDIVVATPMSLVHLLEADAVEDNETTKQKKHIRDLSSVQHLILDEADVLLDPLFKPQTLAVFNALTSPTISTSFWSATISSTIETLIRALLSRSAHPLVRIVVGLKDSAVPNITHRLTYCATERGKLLALRDLLVPKSTPSGPALRAPFLVFTQTIERCTALHKELKYDIPVSAGGSSRVAVLHSELPDRVRDKILTNFRKGEIWVLITTDLLARGVDFRGVNGVVNYDVPTSAAGYVHRVGRTGRAGREGGVAVTLYTKEDVKYVKVVANVIAAAEKARGKTLGDGEKGVEQWLLDALPDVSKEDRRMLKKRGVEERRKGKKEGRIETRGGWERQAEKRKRDMIGASKRARERGVEDLGSVQE